VFSLLTHLRRRLTRAGALFYLVILVGAALGHQHAASADACAGSSSAPGQTWSALPDAQAPGSHTCVVCAWHSSVPLQPQAQPERLAAPACVAIPNSGADAVVAAAPRPYDTRGPPAS
jgi:hypothetical protein